ncbi:ankyrin repeat domain-containing protein [Streptomyces sp. NPDC004069]
MRNDQGRTPLVMATKAHHVKLARLLLESGADPNVKDEIQDSAFVYAGAEGLNEILQLTLQYGADVRSTNRFGGTALIPAGEHRDRPGILTGAGSVNGRANGIPSTEC